MAAELEIKFYFAYTSPFTYLAMEPAYALERDYRVRLRFIPFGVNIRKVYGGEVDQRDERNRRKLRYLYLDARRMAAERGLTIYPPKQIYSARLAFYGGMCAEDQGLFRPYAERVFERFWRRELAVENADELAAILEEIGADSAPFRAYVADEEAAAKPRLKACFAEADRDQVFGVPTLVIDGERFWGVDRMEWVRRKLDAMRLRR
ncbi:MAG TPA: DsbA family protein [Candidatus Binataceae bacterium]|jgi:2-hydroxychromene-2-carboxylate isomerase|nr:DsbA family protein [Candidatus Binataceae bacterium]